MIGLWITIYFFTSLTQLSLGRTAVCTVCNGYYICGVKGYNILECVNGHPCGREQFRLCLKMVSKDPNGFLLGRNTTTAVSDDKRGQTRYRRSVASEDMPTNNSSPEEISEIFNRDVVERDFNGAAGMQYRLYGLGERSGNETATRTRKSVISVENVIKNIILEQNPTGTYDLEKLQADIEEQTIKTLTNVGLMKVKLNITTCEDENKNENLNIPSITIIAITDCNCQNKSYRNDEKESGGNSTSKIYDYSYETYTKPSVWAESMSSEYLTSTGSLLEGPVSASVVGFPENKQTVVIIESTTGANTPEWSPLNQSTVGIPPTTKGITRSQTTTLGRSTDLTAGSDVTYSKSTEIPRTTSAGTSSFKTSQSGQPLHTFYTQETTQEEIRTTASGNFTTAESNKPDSKPSTSTKLATLPSFDTSQSVQDSEIVFISQATQKRDEKPSSPTEKYTSDYFTTASGYIPNSKHPSIPTTTASDAFNSSPPFLKISQSTERGTVSEKTERQPTTVEKFTSHDYIASGSDIQDNKHSERTTISLSAKVTTPSLLATGQTTEQTNKNEAFATTSAEFPASDFVSTGTTTPKVSIKEQPDTNYIESTVKTSPLISSSTLETSTTAISTDVKTPAETSGTIVPTPNITPVEIPSTQTAATAVGPGITSHGNGEAFHCPSVGFFRDPNDCHSFYRCRREVVNCSDCDSTTWKLTRSRYTCEDGKWFSNFFWKCVEAKPLEC